MWQLSDKALKLTRKLDDLGRKKTSLAKRKMDEIACSLLAELAATREPRGLSCTIRFLFAPSAKVQAAARLTIAALLSAISPYELLHLNEILGSLYGWFGCQSWDQLAPGDLGSIAGESHDAGYCAVMGLASFHRNGYVRQVAVDLLSKIVDGSELPFLLIRQNDWVRPVAQHAQAAVSDRINDASLPHLVKCLQLIVHLKVLGRFDHDEVVSRTVDLLLDERHDDILREIIDSSAREVRYEVVSRGLKQEGTHRVRISSHGLSSDDPIVRLACCRCLPSFHDQDSVLRAVDALANDRFMPVRREALGIKATHFPDLAVETWRRALLDQSFSMRDLARFHLTKLGLPDTASFYRAQISKDPDLLAAIEGLSETGDRSDGDYFKQLMNHRFPSRRSAAIRGLGRAYGESAVDEIVIAFRDVSPSVVREARKTIAAFPASIPAEKLLSVVLEVRRIFAQRNSLSLIADLGKWRSTAWLLQAASQTEGEISRFAEDLIQQWFASHRTWTRPTARERDEIVAALAQSQGRISAAIVSLVENDLARP